MLNLMFGLFLMNLCGVNFLRLYCPNLGLKDILEIFVASYIIELIIILAVNSTKIL